MTRPDHNPEDVQAHLLAPLPDGHEGSPWMVADQNDEVLRQMHRELHELDTSG